MSYGSSISPKKFQLNISIHAGVMIDFVFWSLVKKFKKRSRDFWIPYIPSVGIVGVPSTHQHRPSESSMSIFVIFAYNICQILLYLLANFKMYGQPYQF